MSQTFYPHPVEVRFVEDSSLLFEKRMVGVTGNIYTGFANFEDRPFLLRVLRPKDIFADVGTNVGVHTVLASNIFNSKGQEAIIIELNGTGEFYGHSLWY